MPARRVRLSTIDVTRFEDSFKASHSVFLVELWTLGEICHSIEIFDLEKVGSPLRAAFDYLG
jgi:hypothetical protein